MGRRHGPKFSFPIPGRKSNTKVDTLDDETDSIPSIPSASGWSSRHKEPSNYSKAERVLGTAGPPFRPSSRQASVPQSPGYMTITVSEASFGSEYDDRASSTAVEDTGFYHPKRPSMSTRPSSNILGHRYHSEGRRGSDCSSISRRLHPRTSNSTMHSHYDAQSSPLSVSQQTSDSAVRDRALRKGKPQIVPGMFDHGDHVPSPLSRELSDDTKRQHRKSKPPRLDLSKLFPKPRAQGSQEFGGALLSPNKMVNSPSALSTASDFFPRPMTREPTPTPKGQAKLTKAPKRQQASAVQHPMPTSPVRLHQRDPYDSAKINVRRPPRGIQHWFDGLDDDSDGSIEEKRPPVHAPRPIRGDGTHLAPVRKSSLGRLIQDTSTPPQPQRSQQHVPASRKDQFKQASQPVAHRFNSPSQFSLSQTSLVSSRTKESTFSKSNLQDSSVLSISSSEDEEEEEQTPATSKFTVRDSIETTGDHGDIVIGQAHAFEVLPRNRRRPSEGKLSVLSNSTNAATIEVMYTPEPYTPHVFPRSHNSSRRSSHIRQPSMIPEDEVVRPKTSNQPLSPSSTSVRSARTSASEPRSRAEQHKLMAVTEEEEALLEMMRKKRAAMAKQSFTEGYQSAMKLEDRQSTPPENTKKPLRTSAFLATESPAHSPVRAAESKSKRMSHVGSASPLLVPPSRGRPLKAAQDAAAGSSMLRDSSSCDPDSERQASPSSQATLLHRLSPPPQFSPLDPFPTPDASMASPTTTDHASPLPSPITPRLRHGEADVDVKVASSEPSYNGDSDEVAVLETGVIDPPSGSIKPDESHPNEITTHHQRRRTASSGTDVTFPVPPNRTTHDLAPVSEVSSRAPSIIEPIHPQPKLAKKNSRRMSGLTVSTNGLSRSRHNSVTSRTSSPITVERRSSKAISRNSSIASIKPDSVNIGTASTRCSVSEDVLAAWGSLGGIRDFDRY